MSDDDEVRRRKARADALREEIRKLKDGAPRTPADGPVSPRDFTQPRSPPRPSGDDS